MTKDYLLKLHFAAHGEADGYESPWGQDIPDTKTLLKNISGWHDDFPGYSQFEFDVTQHSHSHGLISYQWWLVGCK